MSKQFSLLLIAIFSLFSFSIEGQSLWKKSNLSEFRSTQEDIKITIPEHYIAYTLSFDDLKSKLLNAPLEDFTKDDVEGILIELPMPDGSFETFEVFDSPMFAPKLAAKYPQIKSYKGVSIENPSMNVRFDTGPYGFHAAIHDLSGVYYIDPFTKSTTTEYITYDVEDQMSQMEFDVPTCGVEGDYKVSSHNHTSSKRSSGPVPLNTYRFALACTGEWGAIRGTVEKALADMNTGLNRMNQIFENEVAVRLILIDNNELLLNFDSSIDPYLQTASGSDMLGDNTNILNVRVGPGAYDVGHVYHTGCDVGGIAFLGSMCRSNNKGGGVTCHSSVNLDYFAAAVTSHELGHQMAASHTFNNCNGNESQGTAYEPGSGSTIMSYGGLCGSSLNVVGNGQGGDYYHVASLMQMYNHTRGDGIAGDGCGEQVATSNLEPTIDKFPESGFYIPENTYFYLEGEATDENDDQLTYTWEQFNRGPSSPLGAPIGDAPHFRSLPPSPSPIRYFPSADNIIFGNFDRSEVSFKGDRTVNFIFTVRDNNPEAGAAVWEEVEFNVVETPVKFGVTSQNTTQSYKVGEEVEITWNVAGTDVAPVNAERIDILLFTGNQNNFDLDNTIVLAKNALNSGTCKVIMPNVESTDARFIVKASESIFFSINRVPCIIEAESDPYLILNSDPIAYKECLPTELTYTIETDNFVDIDGNLTLSVLDGMPEGAVVTFNPAVVPIGTPSTMTITPIDDFMSNEYEIRIGAVTTTEDTFSRVVYLDLVSPDHSTVDAISPENGITGVGIAPEFSWVGSINADSYTFELSSSPAFGTSNLISVEELTDLNYKPAIFLEKNTVYYWRVISRNFCGDDTGAKIYAFSTESLFCVENTPAEDVLPINISGSGKPTIQAPIEVSLDGSVADVNVKQFFGEHGNNKDMIVSLISPDGKEVILVGNKCEQQNFNCGFDDASDVDVKCPLNNGSVYKPQESLEAFNGDNLKGTWLLQIEDTKSGNGGKLEGLIIEFCSNQVLDNPYIVRNEMISMGWGGTRVISSDLLEVDDDNNSKEELIYTIVELPSNGELTFDGNALVVGDQFTQQEINDSNLEYNAGEADYQTYFSFTVVDGEGGFIGITNFDIEVNELTSVENEILQEEISVYPVPARDLITIDFSKSDVSFTQLALLNIHGQSVLKRNIVTNDNVNLDVSLLPSGFYIINIRSQDRSISKKIIIE